MPIGCLKFYPAISFGDNWEYPRVIFSPLGNHGSDHAWLASNMAAELSFQSTNKGEFGPLVHWFRVCKFQFICETVISRFFRRNKFKKFP